MLSLERLRVESRKKDMNKKPSRVITAQEIQDCWTWFQEVGWIDTSAWRVKDYSFLNNSLKDQPCVVIGSSIASKGLDFMAVKKIKSIAVNHVIEKFPLADMLLFQDQRFLRKTTFNLDAYKGYIFCSNQNPYGRKQKDKKNICYFKPIQNNQNPSTDINRGVYTRKSSGVCALNIALILGCNPVYLVGMDTPKEFNETYEDGNQLHIVKDYGGAPNTKQALDSYTHIAKTLFSKFAVYGSRIINVCENGHLDFFSSMSMDRFNTVLRNMK